MEIKARAKVALYSYFEQGTADVVIVKGDRKKPVICFYLDDFLERGWLSPTAEDELDGVSIVKTTEADDGGAA